MLGEVVRGGRYQIVPFARTAHGQVYVHRVFLPDPLAQIDLAHLPLRGRYSLFAAFRLVDLCEGLMVTFEFEEDMRFFHEHYEEMAQQLAGAAALEARARALGGRQ